MPIPPFNADGVLPPHLGDPAAGLIQLSPYPVTLQEVCQRWGSDPARRAILSGLLGLRGALRLQGIVQGFQWLDGSFVEDVEHTRGRPPNDVDVVTFYVPVPVFDPAGAALLPTLQDRDQTRTVFRVDHLPVPLNMTPAALVETTRYWTGLFSHRRGDDVWKGMLRVELADPADDVAAQATLAALAPPHP